MKQIRIGIAQKVQFRERWQEPKRSLGDVAAVFSDQEGFEFLPDGMQVQHVRGGVGELFRREGWAAPIGGLLLF